MALVGGPPPARSRPSRHVWLAVRTGGGDQRQAPRTYEFVGPPWYPGFVALPPRRWIEVVLLLALLAALGNWLFARYQRGQTAAETAELATLLDLGPQSRIADVGAGDGRFTVPLARQLLPDGYIYATEIDLERLEDIELAVARASLDNVTILESSADDTGLPPNCCDGVFLRTVYHHLTEPSTLVNDLFNAVRPGGRLVIIDFPPSGVLSFIARVEGVPDNRGGHGVTPDIVVEEVTAAGFTLEDRIDEWRGGNYALVFTKPS